MELIEHCTTQDLASEEIPNASPGRICVRTCDVSWSIKCYENRTGIESYDTSFRNLGVINFCMHHVSVRLSHIIPISEYQKFETRIHFKLQLNNPIHLDGGCTNFIIIIYSTPSLFSDFNYFLWI